MKTDEELEVTIAQGLNRLADAIENSCAVLAEALRGSEPLSVSVSAAIESASGGSDRIADALEELVTLAKAENQKGD